MNYFVKIDDEETGPFSFAQIRLRLSEHGLDQLTLIRREDSQEWVPAGSVKEFSGSGKPATDIKNPMATLSLTLGFASVWLLLILGLNDYPYFLIAGIPAIFFGHAAISKISQTPARVAGYRSATYGLRLGYSACLILPIVFAFTLSGGAQINQKGNQTKAISNCRQIITAMRIYASDCAGSYPDYDVSEARSSNEVFRQFFKAGILNNEMIFGCPHSPFNPDGNIGTSPNYEEAVKPGENHWALTKDQTDSSSGSMPIVYENPAQATWPQKWQNPKYSKPGTPEAGRAWSNSTVVIGTNDSSVTLLKLEDSDEPLVGLKPLPDGEQVFGIYGEIPKILNVAK